MGLRVSPPNPYREKFASCAMARQLPFSAARRYHSAAWSRSRLTPSPRSKSPATAAMLRGSPDVSIHWA